MLNSASDDNHRIWQRAVTATLGGKSADVLVAKTLDGIERGPLASFDKHRQSSGDAGQFPFTRAKTNSLDEFQPWNICSEIVVTKEDEYQANTLILQELGNGANAIQLQFSHSNIDLGAVLQGVDFKLANISFEPGDHNVIQAGKLRHIWQNQDIDTSKITAGFGLPFIAYEQKTAETIELVKWASNSAPNVQSLTICSMLVHESGGTEALELAWLAAETAHNMRILLHSGMHANNAAKQMQALICLDADLHLGIAKLRAARRVWAQVVSAFGVSKNAACLHIHGRNSRRMFCRYDPWVNILRSSSAAFAAVLGGAQSISVTPFTHRLGQADEMARRLAINTQLVLQEECAAARVIDPAGGSYAHEYLTDQLAQKAWDYFQQIERQGGLQAVIDNGWLAEKTSQMRQQRQGLIRNRKIAITGVSEYANLDETIPKTRDNNPPAIIKNLAGLSQMYDAAEFETVREQANKLSQEVFLASIGSLSQSAGRAGFISSLMAAGGIKTTEAREWENQANMLADYNPKSTPIVVICGTDQQYSKDAEQLLEQFWQAGAKQVWIAGDKNHLEGFSGKIALGDDAIELLQKIQLDLGVKND